MRHNVCAPLFWDTVYIVNTLLASRILFKSCVYESYVTFWPKFHFCRKLAQNMFRAIRRQTFAKNLLYSKFTATLFWWNVCNSRNAELCVVRLQRWNEFFCSTFCHLVETRRLTLVWEPSCSPDDYRRFAMLMCSYQSINQYIYNNVYKEPCFPVIRFIRGAEIRR